MPDSQFLNATKNMLMMKAAQEGVIEEINLLLEDLEININAANENGMTALMLAAANGHVAAVRSLANDARNDVNVANKSGRTALIWAADRGYATKIVRSLLRAPGIDITMATNHNVEALRWIARDWAFYRGS